MLYFPSFYCVGPIHNGKLVRFDVNLHKPVSGTCGHSVCQLCQKNNFHMKCPTCSQENVFFGREPNDQAMRMTVKCRDNFLKVLRIWWRGERFGIGACSECFKSSPSLRLCLVCHSNLYSKHQESSALILKTESFPELMEISRKVLCEDCALSKHHENGHRLERLDNFSFDEREVRTNTAREILTLFREDIKQKRSQIDCKLRKMRFEYAENQFSELLERKFDSKDSNNLRESIRHALVGLHIEHLIIKTEELINESSEICECSRIYRKLTAKFGNSEDLDQLYSNMAYYRIERFSMGCPFYFKSRNEARLGLYRKAEEKPQKIFTDVLPKSPCSLCKSLNGSEETRVRKVLSDYVRDYKNNETVDLTLPHSLCLRCLNILDGNFK